jgi:hypothetical protein
MHPSGARDDGNESPAVQVHSSKVFVIMQDV